MKFFDLFAGIGGFRLALEREGYECVGFCEIDKYARRLYKAYYDTEGEVEYEDAKEIIPEDLPDFDVLCAGFPCQAFSIAGKRRGFEDTRGTLFFEIAKIARVKRPTHLLLENVKGLLSHDKGRTFEIILQTLDGLGYDVEWQVLNSKDFGVPQNRERVFIVGHFRGRSKPKIFPLTEADKVYYRPPKVKKEIRKDSELAGTLTARQYANWNRNFVYDPYNAKLKKENVVGTLRTNYSNGNSWIVEVKGGSELIKVGFVGDSDSQGNRVYSINGISTTLSSQGGGGGAKTGLYLTEDLRIRRLTPLECFRLQGFPDDVYHKAKELGISDARLYKMTGNAVTVQVVQSIARKLKNKSSFFSDF